ncbi:MAG: hypothetical protein BWY02_02598 [bacterium ADurb.Bin157]|nr:MAG: hypothetical protein BWY02_02598 [bacterium ADurb.Bin157]
MKEKQMIIRAITKTDKKVVDKYCVYFWGGAYLTISANPNSPQGVSMFGESYGINDLDFEASLDGQKINGNEILINWFELPPIVQNHVQKRIEMKG